MNESTYYDLHSLLDRLVLGDRRASVSAPTPVDLEYAVSHVLEALSAKSEHVTSTLHELRLRIALHLSPLQAIRYDRLNPRPRHILVRQFLKEEFGRSGPIVEQLARDVARVLDDWEVSRDRVTGHLEGLLRVQKGRCKHCGAVLWPRPATTVENDPYKPYFVAPDELLSAEVDHIDPVSGFGTNREENLQALCRLCNMGKGDGLGLNLRDEVRYAAEPVESIPFPYRARMFYYVVERCRRKCAHSGRPAEEVELTIRPIRLLGGYVRSNLHAVAFAG
jgi:5-methylcytosine-specific restriction endonuclease McrA